QCGHRSARLRGAHPLLPDSRIDRPAGEELSGLLRAGKYGAARAASMASGIRASFPVHAAAPLRQPEMAGRPSPRARQLEATALRAVCLIATGRLKEAHRDALGGVVAGSWGGELMQKLTFFSAGGGESRSRAAAALRSAKIFA